MLSIIIVSYHSDEFLRECLDSIFKFNDIGHNLEVIVVDNARSQKTKDIVASNERVRYLENDNTGFGAGNNVGALHSKNEFLLFLNPDTVLIEPIFSFAIKRFQLNVQLRAFGMLLVDEHGRSQETFGFFPEKIKLLPEKFYLSLIKLGYTPSRIFPWGANLFVRKEDFVQAGMFDENIFMCYEEPDLLRRLPKGEVKIFTKKIVHKAGHSNENLIERYQLALQSEKYYFLKYGLNYIQYIKINLCKIRVSIIFKKLFSLKIDRERLLLELYSKVLSEKDF